MVGKKNSISIEDLKSLCNFKDNIYTSKYNKEYIDALSNLFALNNKNDNPFTKEDILKQPLLKDFNFIGVKDYKSICKLKAEPMIIKNNERINERIVSYDFIGKEEENIFKKALGVSYLITALIEEKEYIIKIGQSRTTFKKRLGSYNCGVVFNWRTASTTNIKMLQSMLTTGLEFNLYIYDCSDEPYSINWHGIKSIDLASPKSLAVEDIMIKKFIEIFNKKPLANIQANATEINDD